MADWKWYGNAGHFIMGNHCRFHLCTKVGKYLVSTVGQLWMEEGSREITANARGISLVGRGDERAYDYMKKIGYEPVGSGPEIFETMVFRAGKPCSEHGCDCGQPTISGSELNSKRYMTAGEATKGHYKFCKQYERKR